MYHRKWFSSNDLDTNEQPEWLFALNFYPVNAMITH